MKVLLIVPPSSLEERYGVMKDVGTLYPSLGLAYVAVAAKLEGCEVMVLDSEAMGFNFNDIRRKIIGFSPDLIGMQTFFTNLDRSFEVARIAKEIDSGINVCLGGPEATMSPHVVISNNYVDFVVVGEGDITVKELILALKGKLKISSVNGLLYKENGDIRVNNPRSLVDKLDILPLPARELFPMHKYHSSANLRGKKTLNLITSRGCPFRCAYCAGHKLFGKTYRYNSAERVIQEIRILIEKYGADSLQFYDDTFTLVKNRIYDLCGGIIREGIKIQWSCFTRVNLVDEELLIAMKKSGCYQIFYGIESGVQRLLNLIEKDITLDQARKAVKATKKAGIEAFCSFMLALPTETREDSLETTRFALELDPDYVQFPITTPFPNTKLYEIARKSGVIISDARMHFTSWDKVAYLPQGRTEDEIIDTVRMAYRLFYNRPSYLFKRIAKFRKLPLKKIAALIKSGVKTMWIKKS